MTPAHKTKPAAGFRIAVKPHRPVRPGQPERPGRPSWDRYFMDIAVMVATRAVLVNRYSDSSRMTTGRAIRTEVLPPAV